MACIAAAPIVDGIEQEQRGRLRVIRLNVQDPVGRALAAELGGRVTPTFIFFDAEGREVWRSVGAINPAQVRSSLE